MSSKIKDESNIYDQDGVIEPQIIENLEKDIQGGQREHVRDLIRDLHETETADILQAVNPDNRQKFVELCGKEFDFAALTEVDEVIRAEVIDALPKKQVVKGVRELDSDDAVYILEDLPENECEEILKDIPIDERDNLRQCLEYPNESAGRRMQTEFIAVPPTWNVGQVIDHIRKQKDLPERFFDIFVVDEKYKIVGALTLDTLLKAKREIKIEKIQNVNAHPVPVEMDQEEAATILKQYNLLSAPVVDENNQLLGVLTIDDVVDVLQEEADEDIKRLAGVGDEELSDSVVSTAQSRLGWLAVNLVTALLASWIIGLFQATIDQMVALAVLMPLVASMGGNAGTQTMTVAVRAIAEHDLDKYNAKRIIGKELLVGMLNGVAFAVIIGIIAVLWFGPVGLGIVIGTAVIVNMFFAAASGILVPLALNRVGADPAIASGVFVTTVTDVIGFFAFLALAAVWLVG